MFTRAGGFDERRLRVIFNDVDLCLRLREAGHRIVWTPSAGLWHLESASRTTRRTDPVLVRDAGWVCARWCERLASDPYWNPDLSPGHFDFRPAAPRARRDDPAAED